MVHRMYHVLILLILTAITFMFGCISRKSSHKSTDYVARKFYVHDTLQVKMIFYFGVGCMPSYGSDISISKTAANDTYFIKFNRYDKPIPIDPDLDDSNDSFAFKGNPIALLDSFERRARNEKDCDGYGGNKNMIMGSIRVNGLESRFNYCKTYWDGLEILLTELRKRKIDR